MAVSDMTVLFETHHEILVEWMIPKLPSLNFDVTSPEFEFSNTNWWITFTSKDISGDLSIHLFRNATSWCHPISFFFCVQSGDCVRRSLEIIHTFDKIISRFGYVFSAADFRDVTLEGRACKVLCFARLTNDIYPKILSFFKIVESVRTSPTIEELSSSAGVEDLSKDLKDSFLKEHLYDVQIKVGDRRFKAHKFILAARSTVFAAMFDHEMTETRSGVVEIDDCDPDTFRDFLLALYTGKYDHVASGTTLGLYKIADKYDFKHLKAECSSRLSRELSVDVVCDVIQLATMHGEYEMLKNATEFFLNNARETVSGDRWKAFMVEEPTLASELIIKLARK